MLDVKFIMQNIESVKKNLAKRGIGGEIIEQLLDLNEQRKKLTTFDNDLRAEVKALSREIGSRKQKGDPAEDLVGQVASKKMEIEKYSAQLANTELQQNNLLLTLPNLIDDNVPVGQSDADNQLLFVHGVPKVFDFPVKDHVALGEELKMLDFDAAARVTGSRFVFSKGMLAQMERALINFMLDQHIQHGYTEVIPPFIVHERSLVGTGQLPKFKEDLFKLENFDWYLTPTAEVPVTNLRREEIFRFDELPLRYCAYTPCFRSEAGSYGRDTRGMIRQHQFNKVELVNIVAPDYSYQAHEEMIQRAASILELLGLPFRGMLLCSTDIGFGAQRCVDLEVWLPAQNQYREISSISNCGDFQARRAQIRYRTSDGKVVLAHTLNGSGLAVGRTLVAIMENYQLADGSIEIPPVLRPYLQGKARISK